MTMPPHPAPPTTPTRGDPVNLAFTIERYAVPIRWSMRSWESVPFGAKRRRGLPRSHGPSGRRAERKKVDQKLTSRSAGVRVGGRFDAPSSAAGRPVAGTAGARGARSGCIASARETAGRRRLEAGRRRAGGVGGGDEAGDRTPSLACRRANLLAPRHKGAEKRALRHGCPRRAIVPAPSG